MPASNGLAPKADLEHERQQERRHADRDPRQQAGGHRAERERGNGDGGKIEHAAPRGAARAARPRIRNRGRTRQIRRPQPAPVPPCATSDRPWINVASAAAVSRKPIASNRACPSLGLFRHEAQHEIYAEEADRDVEEEDPAPRRVGGDESAERRSDHRCDQRRPDDQADRVDDVVLGRFAQDDETPDRRHERRGGALQQRGRR